MVISNEELLRKATLDTSAFGGGGAAPLTVEQVQEFLRVAIAPQNMLPVVRTVMSNANKWEESKLIFGSRVMKSGSEGARLDAGDRVAPTTGIVEISTVLLRGEVPVTDEVFEDQVERAGFGDTLQAMIAERVGLDVEELLVNGDAGSGDSYLALLDGWFELADDAADNAQIDCSGDGQDYQTIFNKLLVNMPDAYKRDKANMRYFAPIRLVEKYTDILAARGTPLGDFMLEGARTLRYQGIEIVGVSILGITSGSPDTCEILLTHRLNLYAGYRRMIKLETWRDPREGATSFVVTARVAAAVAHTPATTLAQSVDIEP
jgi:hypothetical protein